jgi:hypothetical protein
MGQPLIDILSAVLVVFRQSPVCSSFLDGLTSYVCTFWRRWKVHISQHFRRTILFLILSIPLIILLMIRRTLLRYCVLVFLDHFDFLGLRLSHISLVLIRSTSSPIMIPAMSPPPDSHCPRSGCDKPYDPSKAKYHQRVYHQENVTMKDGPSIQRGSSGEFQCPICPSYSNKNPYLMQVCKSNVFPYIIIHSSFADTLQKMFGRTSTTSGCSS